jgi:uncharacterized protein
MSKISLRTLLLITTLCTVPVFAHADPADEARRQAQMQSSRDSAAAIDRRNADQAFQQGLARSSSLPANSGSSSNSGGSSSGGTSPLPGGRANDSAYSGGMAAEGYNTSTGQITVNVSGGGGVAAARAAVAGLTAPSLAQTAQRLAREAAAGNAQSQYQLGRMYASGYGVSENMTEARRLFVAAANQGHVEASAYAGQFLLRATGGPEDDPRAEQYLETAAQAGNVDAKAELGTHYVLAANEGNGYRQISRGLRYMEEAADAGKATAQSILGAYVYFQGYGNIQPDSIKALKYLRMGSAQGESLSLRQLGTMMVMGHPSTGTNLTEGWQLLTRAIQLGDGDAMSTLGLAKLYGKQGQALDVSGGMSLLRQSAEAGDPNGMILYGDRLRQGVHVAMDEVAGTAYVRRAAEAGNANGMLTWAMLLFNGVGTAVNKPEAIRYYRLAAEAGNGLAQQEMGLFYYSGEVGIAKNLVEAARWARMSADDGEAKGQLLFGLLLWGGEGVVKDRAQAVRYFKLAADQGDEQAINNLKEPEVAAILRTLRN